jgi:transcriptional regulator with XRE-family HTH domain
VSVHPLWDSRAARAAAAAGKPGQVLRLARQAAGLCQVELGARTGYSAATISRFETGRRPLTDLGTLRRFCDVLAISPVLFGLAAQRHELPQAPGSVSAAAPPARVVTDQLPDSQDGDGPVDRRELLTAVASLAGVAVIAGPGRASAPSAADPRIENLEALLLAQDRVAPAPVPSLKRSVAAARASFDACQYHLLSLRLPPLIARLEASASAARTPAHREQLLRLTSDAYCLASHLCVKLGEDAMAWVTADRALRAARRGGNPVPLAAASRRVSIAMRRQGHHQAAVTILTSTALELDAGRPGAPASDIAAYGSLLSTAAYTAARAGRQHQALELISEAAAAAARLPGETPGFDADYVSQYQVGVLTLLGDPASALRHAATLTPRALPTPQRRARLCIDTARAWQAFGKPDRTLQSLLAAESFAAEEVCRPSVQTMTISLLDAPGPKTAMLRAFATRCGATA